MEPGGTKVDRKGLCRKGNLSRILYLKPLKIVFFSKSLNDEAEGNRCNAEKEAKKVSQVFLIIQGGGKLR
jgi:hypothetical protein